MRSILYLLLAAVLLSTELTSCITDHRSVSPSPGQNYQLAGYVINSSSYSPAQSVGSLTLQRDNNGRILRAISAITYPNNPRTQLTQIFSYNTDNLLVESKVILDSAYFSIASGLGERRVYEYENQRIKTIRKFNNNAYNPNLTSIIYEDQVTYDAQGRLARAHHAPTSILPQRWLVNCC